MTVAIQDETDGYPPGTRIIIHEGEAAGRCGNVVSVSPNYSAMYRERCYIAVCVDTGMSMLVPESNTIKSPYQNETLD